MPSHLENVYGFREVAERLRNRADRAPAALARPLLWWAARAEHCALDEQATHIRDVSGYEVAPSDLAQLSKGLAEPAADADHRERRVASAERAKQKRPASHARQSRPAL